MNFMFRPPLYTTSIFIYTLQQRQNNFLTQQIRKFIIKFGKNIMQNCCFNEISCFIFNSLETRNMIKEIDDLATLYSSA